MLYCVIQNGLCKRKSIEAPSQFNDTHKFYKKLTYHRLSQTDLGSYKKVQDFFFKIG